MGNQSLNKRQLVFNALSIEIFPVHFVAMADRRSDLSVGLPKLILHTTTPLKCSLREGQRSLFVPDGSFGLNSVILIHKILSALAISVTAPVGAFFVGVN